MGTLQSAYTREDIDTLIEAVGDWENVNNHDYYAMKMIENVPMPPEDSEAHEVVTQIKRWYAERRKEIEASKATRQERAVFLKAKLMLTRQDMSINQLLEMATSGDAATNPAADKLALAELFIRDLGVQGHYEKFLAEKASA